LADSGKRLAEGKRIFADFFRKTAENIL